MTKLMRATNIRFIGNGIQTILTYVGLLRYIMRCLYILNIFTEVLDILQGHEFYNPTKKNYIFLRSCYDELKPRTSS